MIALTTTTPTTTWISGDGNLGKVQQNNLNKPSLI